MRSVGGNRITRMTTVEAATTKARIEAPAAGDPTIPLFAAGALATASGIFATVMALLLMFATDTVADIENRPESEFSGFGTFLLIFGLALIYGGVQAIRRRPAGRSLCVGLPAIVIFVGVFGLSGEGTVFRWFGVLLIPLIIGAGAWFYSRGQEHSELTSRIAAAVTTAAMLVLFIGWHSNGRFFQVTGFVLFAIVVTGGLFVGAQQLGQSGLVASAAAAAGTFVTFFVGGDGTITQTLGVTVCVAIVALALSGASEADYVRVGGGIEDGWRVAFWFLLPSLVGFFVFFLLPSVRAVGISFQDFPLLESEGTWIGLENYREVLGDDLFRNAAWVTLKYVVINIGIQTILALSVAVMMDRLTKSVFVRSILLLPWLLPNVMVGLLWLFMLDPTNGIVNEWLGYFGIDSIGFLSNPSWSIPALAMINTWKFTGYTALLLFAGIQTVPGSLYEAASLDGASEFKMFRTITLPLLRPVLVLVLVISLIGSFQVFDIIAAAGGGLGGSPGDPLNSTRVLYLYIYDKSFVDNFGARAGQGAAAATLLMIGLLIITVIQLRLSRASESDLA